MDNWRKTISPSIGPRAGEPAQGPVAEERLPFIRAGCEDPTSPMCSCPTWPTFPSIQMRNLEANTKCLLAKYKIQANQDLLLELLEPALSGARR
jgi:hypothetical protein